MGIGKARNYGRKEWIMRVLSATMVLVLATGCVSTGYSGRNGRVVENVGVAHIYVKAQTEKRLSDSTTVEALKVLSSPFQIVATATAAIFAPLTQGVGTFLRGAGTAITVNSNADREMVEQHLVVPLEDGQQIDFSVRGKASLETGVDFSMGAVGTGSGKDAE